MKVNYMIQTSVRKGRKKISLKHHSISCKVQQELPVTDRLQQNQHVCMSALDVTQYSFAQLHNIQSTHAYGNSVIVSVLSVEETLATRYLKQSGATVILINKPAIKCRLLLLDSNKSIDSMSYKQAKLKTYIKFPNFKSVCLRQTISLLSQIYPIFIIFRLGACVNERSAEPKGQIMIYRRHT